MVSNDLKKNKAEAKLRNQKKSDLTVNRMMFVFIAAVIAVSGMLAVKKSVPNELKFAMDILPVLLIVSSAGLAAAIVFFALRSSRHTEEAAKIFTKWNVLGAAAVLFLACVYYRLTLEATMVIYGVIAATALYFVFSIFKKDFFIFSVLSAAGLLLLKMSGINYYSAAGSLITTVSLILTFVFAAAGIVTAILLAAGKGKLSFGDKKIKVYGEDGHIYPIFVASALMIAGGIIGFVAPAYVIYAVAAILAAYLAIAVVYVIKMM